MENEMNLSQKIEKTRAELEAMVGDNYLQYYSNKTSILKKSQELDNLLVQYTLRMLLVEKQS